MKILKKAFIASILFLLTVIFFCQASHGGFNIDTLKKQAGDIYNKTSTGGNLTNTDVIKGLKEALTIGIKNASSQASKMDGFYKNTRIRIPFPPEAQTVRATAEKLGMKNQIEDFVRSMNRAAEEAAKEALPIFVNAITQMTITDGFTILKGPNDAATSYLRQKTMSPLTQKFRPIVKGAIQRVQVTKYWSPIIMSYNKIPFVKKMNPDLDAYVTERALRGLFTLIGNEEKKIRQNPSARVTALLQRVFE